MTFGFIGLGSMGGAIASALHTRGEARIAGTTRSASTAAIAAQRLGIAVGTDNAALARASDVIVLCVKPYQARALVEAIAGELAGKVLVSVCASVTTLDLRSWSGDRVAVVRAMPNTPALVGAGMTVLAPGATTSAAQLDIVTQMFAAVGRTAILGEALMDAATGLSGCGPAYVFMIIDALADAGVQLGIDRATSTTLAAQTLFGAAQLVLERGVHPAVLKDQVTTPGGCTIDGLVALEDGGLRSTLIAGVVAAATRSRTLREDAP